jgi:predicted GNAT family acetyltransferase
VDADAHAEIEVEIADHPERNRYELRHDGEVVGFVDYRIDGEVMVIPYVEVLPRLRGKGHSEPFLDEVLADVDARGFKVVPLCGYAAAHIRSRPALVHLLA